LFTESDLGSLTNRHYPLQTTWRLPSNCWKAGRNPHSIQHHSWCRTLSYSPPPPLLLPPRIWEIHKTNFRHAQNSEGSVQVQPSSYSQKILWLYNFSVVRSIMDEW